MQSSLFHFQAVDTVWSSHPVLFSGCLRQLLAVEMKDACLAAFKDTTLNVTGIAKPLLPHFMSNMVVMIKRI